MGGGVFVCVIHDMGEADIIHKVGDAGHMYLANCDSVSMQSLPSASLVMSWKASWMKWSR